MHIEAVGGKNRCQTIHEGLPVRAPTNVRCGWGLNAILSVDGIGAYDHVASCHSHRIEDDARSAQVVPFVRLSCAGLPSHTFEGRAASRQPGRGRGAVFLIRIHGALEVIAGQLFDGECLFEAILWAFILTRARRGRGTGAPTFQRMLHSTSQCRQVK